MSDELREQIRRKFDQKTTEELVELWTTNNRLEWSEMTFDIIRGILEERLEELPLQNEPISKATQPVIEASEHPATMTLLQTYFSLNGRIGLESYWLKGILPILALSVLLGLIDATIPTYSPYSGTPRILLWLIVFWPSLALTVKRWHDRDKSGFWVFIGVIPIIGPLWAFVETGFFPGTPGPNQYGLKSF